MRCPAFLLAVVPLIGCATTRTIDADWRTDSVADLQRQSDRRSTWLTNQGEFHAHDFEAADDSIFIDVLRWRGEEPPTGARYLRGGGLLGDRDLWRVAVTQGDVSEIVITGRDHALGFEDGIVFGLSIVGPAAAFMATIIAGMMSDCTQDCTIDWRAPVGGLLVGAVAGSVVGGGVGWLVGTKETTVYRFGDRASISAVHGGVGLRIPLGR